MTVFTTVPNVATGDALLASQQRIYVKNNFEANAPHVITALGDMPVSTGTAIAVIAPGTNGKALVCDNAQAGGRKADYSGLVPVGGIVLWSGAVVDIPTGWSLCDGTLGTPDLRSNFIIGSGSTYATGATGGNTTVNLQHRHTAQTAAAALDHTHTQANTSTDGSHKHTYPAVVNSTEGNYGYSGGAGGSSAYGHGHNVAGDTATDGSHAHANPTTGGAGAGHTHTLGLTDFTLSTVQDVRPPYYALAYVMRTALLIYDSFTDGAVNLDDHTPDVCPVGSAWLLWTGTDGITIDVNKASMAAGEEYGIYVIDCGKSDLIITVDIDIPVDCNVAGIVLRAVDTNNYWRFYVNDTTAYISEKTGGIVTARDSGAHGLAPGVATMTITLRGQDMTLDIGAASLSYSSAVRQTATLVGLVAENVDPIVALTFENLLVQESD